jgi:hypothetical protein
VFSGSYFIYDFFCMLWMGLMEFDMCVHHLMCITGIIQVIAYDNGCGFVVMGLFVAEVSNPPMHVRILLRNVGLRYTRAYEVAEYFYFGLFFIGRIIIGHPAVYMTVTCSENPLFSRIVCIGIML